MKRLLIGLLFIISMGSLAMEETENKAHESYYILDPFDQAAYNFIVRASKSAIGREGTLYWPPSNNKSYHNRKYTIEGIALALLGDINKNCKVYSTKSGNNSSERYNAEFRFKKNLECQETFKSVYELIESCNRVKEHLRSYSGSILTNRKLLKLKKKLNNPLK